MNHRVFVGMEAFWKFFTAYLADMPQELGGDGLMVTDELENPKRQKLNLAPPGSEGSVQHIHAAMQKLAGMMNAVGDVANLNDLHGFPELITCPVPSCHEIYPSVR